MGEMRDSDWSREILLRSDWLQPKVAPYTTDDSTPHLLKLTQVSALTILKYTKSFSLSPGFDYEWKVKRS